MSNSGVGTKRRYAELTTAPSTTATEATATSNPKQTQTRIDAESSDSSSNGGDDASDDDDDSDSSSEVSEYVLVSLPGSLVTRMREQGGGTLQVHDLDSAAPYFHSVTAAPSPSPDGQSPSVPQQRTKYVGSYEYSVGTNLIWQIGLYNPSTSTSASTPAAATDANSSSAPATTSIPPSANPVAKITGSESEPPRKQRKADPSLSFEGNKKDPRLDWVGKTWKKLVFARQR